MCKAISFLIADYKSWINLKFEPKTDQFETVNLHNKLAATVYMKYMPILSICTFEDEKKISERRKERKYAFFFPNGGANWDWDDGGWWFYMEVRPSDWGRMLCKGWRGDGGGNMDAWLQEIYSEPKCIKSRIWDISLYLGQSNKQLRDKVTKIYSLSQYRGHMAWNYTASK